MLGLAGRVIVAGCRDAGAARTLGLVPSHNASTALEMAHGLAGGAGSPGWWGRPIRRSVVAADPLMDSCRSPARALLFAQ